MEREKSFGQSPKRKYKTKMHPLRVGDLERRLERRDWKGKERQKIFETKRVRALQKVRRQGQRLQWPHVAWRSRKKQTKEGLTAESFNLVSGWPR